MKIQLLNFFSHSLIKSSAIVFAGSMSSNIWAWLYHVIVGRILGVSQYGELAAILSLFYIINVPSNTLQTILTKYLSELNAKKRLGEIKWLILYFTKRVLIGEAFLLLFVIPFAPFISNYLRINRSEYFIFLYFIFATFIVSTINGSVLQALQFFKESSILANIGMVLRLLFGILFAPMGVGLVLVSNIISNMITYFFTFIPLRSIFRLQSIRFTVSKRSVVAYSMPAFVSNLSITLLYSQDVVLVKHFFTSESAGLYSSLSVLGKIVFFASSAISYVAFPVIAQYKEQRKNYNTILLLSLAGVAVVSLGITMAYFLWPKQIINLMFGEAFLPALPYMGLFGIFITFFSLASIVITMCLAAGKTRVWLFVSIAAFCQFILINIFHESLTVIIMNNIIITVGLFFTVIFYLLYAKK